MSILAHSDHFQSRMNDVPPGHETQAQSHGDASVDQLNCSENSDEKPIVIKFSITTQIANGDEPKEICLWSQSLEHTLEAATKDEQEYIVISKFANVRLKEFPKLSSVSLERPKGKIIIHCIRHAQAYHNLNTNHPEYDQEKAHARDPKLNRAGKAQARRLQYRFEPMDRVSVVLCSPLKRTLQTAHFGLKPLAKRDMKIVAWPKLREWGTARCCTGSPLTQLKKIAADCENGENVPMDLSLIQEGWETPNDPEPKEVGRAARAEHVRKELWKLGHQMLRVDGGKWNHLKFPPNTNIGRDVEIVVVSHAGFLETLENPDQAVGIYYRNTMYKSYEFASERLVQEGNTPWMLVETDESKARVRELMRRR